MIFKCVCVCALILIMILLIVYVKQKETNSKYYNRFVNEIESTMMIRDLSNIIKYPIYYINLEKAVNRRIYMENQFKKYNIKTYTRINGINGTDKDSYKLNTNYSEFLHSPNILHYHQIGCILSHFLAIKAFYDSNQPIGIIFEDDVNLSPLGHLNNNFTLDCLINAAPLDWEIISLQTSSCNDFNNLDIFLYKRTDELEHCWSAAGYLITRNGAKKIIDQVILNNEFTINHISSGFPRYPVTDEYIYALVNTYYVGPSIIYPYEFNVDDVFRTNDTLVYKYIHNGYPNYTGDIQIIDNPFN